jgi:hypothetical protein
MEIDSLIYKPCVTYDKDERILYVKLLLYVQQDYFMISAHTNYRSRAFNLIKTTAVLNGGRSCTKSPRHMRYFFI